MTASKIWFSNGWTDSSGFAWFTVFSMVWLPKSLPTKVHNSSRTDISAATLFLIILIFFFSDLAMIATDSQFRVSKTYVS